MKLDSPSVILARRASKKRETQQKAGFFVVGAVRGDRAGIIEFRKIRGTYKDTAGVGATSVALISGG